jgi:transposase-like protein
MIANNPAPASGHHSTPERKTHMTPRRPMRTEEEINRAVKRAMTGEAVVTIAKEYKVSRAALYQWIAKARDRAATAARDREIGPNGRATEDRISKELRLKALEHENKQLKQKLFDLMLKHNEI